MEERQLRFHTECQEGRADIVSTNLTHFYFAVSEVAHISSEPKGDVIHCSTFVCCWQSYLGELGMVSSLSNIATSLPLEILAAGYKVLA